MPTPDLEVEAYRKKAERLIKRAEALIKYQTEKIEKLADAMGAAIGAPDFDTAKHLLRTALPSLAPRSGGEPGTQVPEVDPDDLKAVWDVSAKAKWREQAAQVEIGIFERLCKPGADVQAVCYRFRMLNLVATFIQTQQLAPNEAGTLDMKVFTAMAKIPLEWIGEGVREEFPFDVERFLQQCA